MLHIDLPQRRSRFRSRSRRRRRQRHTIQLRLELDDLLQHRIRNTDGRQSAAIDKNSRSRVHAHLRTQRERSIDGVLGSGGRSASSDLDRILTSLGLGILQSGVRRGRREPSLVFKQSIGKLEEGLIATRLGDTISMGRRLKGLVVDLGEGEILEDKVSAGIVGQQLGDRGLCFLAVRALEIGELYNLQRFGSSALRRPCSSRLQNVPIGLKRLGAEGQQ